jgi:hypothetical protein
LRKQNKNIDKSVNTLSIKEFSSIFLKIDDQILQLHKCSSDDFLGLNADFKKCYRKSKVISDNANEIFSYLKETVTGDLLRDLENLYKDLQQIQNNFSKHLGKSIELIKKMFFLLENLFLPVKNLNQDLMTLKFLLANLKINNSTLKNLQGKDFELMLNKFNQVLNDFKIFSFQNESNLVNLKNQVTKTLNVFESINTRNISDLESILNHLHFGIILFAEKHEEISRQIPELTSKTKNSYKSIANIITNLQYHDIIRQKIEHIQKTQKNVLVDLEIASDANDFENILIRTRDIANLQSAQLIHANKEYQQAIEIITQKFITISDDMSNISKICKEINASQENSDELDLQGLLDKFKDSVNVLNRYVQASDNFTNQIDILSVSVNNSSKTVSRFHDAIQALKEITTDTINYFSEANTSDDQIDKSLIQLSTISQDIVKFEGIIQNVFKVIQNIEQEILIDIEDHIKTSKKTISFNFAANRLNSIINTLNDKNILIKKLLEQNFTTSSEISKEVRESISRIRYYDFFEKVIVDIISEFNQISQKLKLELKSYTSKNANDLESLKDIYTMASEHKIHDKVINQEGDIDFFDDKEVNEDENDDNLELF